MLAVGYRHAREVVVVVDEVAHKKCRAAFLESVGHEFQGNIDVCAVALRLHIDDLPDYQKDMLLSLLRWDELFNPVAEKNDSHLVVVLDRRECKRRGNLGDHLLLFLSHGSEVAASADVDQKHHGQLPLLFVNFYERLVLTGCDVPVDITDVVAGLVFPDLGKYHATPLEGCVILSREDVLTQSAGLYLYFPNFL